MFHRFPALLLLMTVSAQMALSVVCAQDGNVENPHARWEPAMRRFEAAELDNPRPRHGLLFVGSSSIRFWNLNKSFPERPVINHGFGGSQIADTIHFAERIVWPLKPDVIVLYAGDNDIAVGKSAETVRDDFDRFSTLVHQRLPKTHLIFIAIKPSIARWSLADEMKRANAAIAAHCADDDQRTFLDVWLPMLDGNGRPNPTLFIKDGLHLNATGYQLWTRMLIEELQQLEQAGPSAKTDG